MTKLEHMGMTCSGGFLVVLWDSHDGKIFSRLSHAQQCKSVECVVIVSAFALPLALIGTLFHSRECVIAALLLCAWSSSVYVPELKRVYEIDILCHKGNVQLVPLRYLFAHS